MNNLSRYTYYIQTLSDLIALIISYFLAIAMKEVIRFGIKVPSYDPYINVLFVALIGYAIASIVFLSKEQNVLNRGWRREFSSAFRNVAITFAVVVFYLFGTQTGRDYSRIFVVVYAGIDFLLTVVLRMLLKKWALPLFRNGKSAEQIIMIGKEKNINSTMERMKHSRDWRFQIVGAVVTDRDDLEYINNVPVIPHKRNLIETLSDESADSLFVITEIVTPELTTFIDRLTETGKTVHININEFDILPETDRYMDVIGGCAAVSYIPFVKMPRRHAFMKRILDVIISLFFIPLYACVYLLTWIFTSIESKGPVLMDMVRVGKNGRRFYKKRFRVLRMDAEERIKEGKSPYMVWGSFLKFTHLNGLPEVVNVLSGDMSMCGPHGPDVQSYLSYSSERRKNLCVLPGIFGSWCIEQDRRQVTRSEREYIKNWSVLKDLEVYIAVFFRYITFHSSRKYNEKALREETGLIHSYIENRKPLQYDHSAYVHKKTAGECVYLFIKRFIDIVLSLMGIIILSPLLLILCIAVMADDGGSPIYKQERIGLHGRKIYIAKFRSMRRDAGDLNKLLTPEQLEQYQKEFKIDNDPRITKVGSFIRKTSLDELPQLFNILGGSLSIIGPRPIVEKETEIYGKDIAKLLSVKPGLTGYWQAYARNNATYETGERQAMEMYYVDHHSLWLDIKIFFRTFKSVAKEEGAQ